MKGRRRILMVCVIVVLGSLWPAALSAEWQAPNVSLLFGGRIFNDGQSNTFGPALNHTVDEYWTPGECTRNADGSPADTCDSLRFGLTMHADIDGAPNRCAWGNEVNHRQVAAQEDGGDPVGDDLHNIHTMAGRTYCDQRATDWQYDPQDDALKVHRHTFFSEAYDPNEPVTDAVRQRWWERPNLVLSIIDEMPQTSDANPDGRVRESLRQACVSFDGSGGIHPAAPTWVMIAPRHKADAPLYGGLLAAAGGTAKCCYAPGGCDLDTDPAIDVCEHIDQRTDAQIRQDIERQYYDCSGSSTLTATGSLDSQTLPNLECHLAGLKCNANYSPDPPTSLFDIMSCIQLRPSDVPPADFKLRYCYDGALNCDILTPGDGLEYVDERKELYIVQGTNADGTSYCSALADKEADTDEWSCDGAGSTCDTGLEGRCGVGEVVCDGLDPICEQQFQAMPEVCNGLDDDCDAQIDNLSTSWDDFPDYDPTALASYDREGIHCYERDLCRCSGASMEHAGDDFASYVSAWQPGTCVCGESLSSPNSEIPARPDRAEPASCAFSQSSAAKGLGLLGAGLLALGLLWRRRRD